MTQASRYMTLIDFQEKHREAAVSFGSFDDWVKGVPDEYLLCRDLGHPWQGDGWEGDHVEKLPLGACLLRMSCERCGLERARYIGPYGEIDGTLNRYNYGSVPGYLYREEDGSGYALGKGDRMKVRAELRRRAQERAAAAARAARASPKPKLALAADGGEYRAS